MTTRRRGALLGGFLLSSLLTTAVSTHFGTLSTGREADQAGAAPTSVQGKQIEKDDAACDVSGVHTSFGSSYSATGAYLINHVVVSEIEATCVDATVTVTLLGQDGSTSIGTGSVVVASSSAQVDLGSKPAASAVAKVHVEIRGGRTPVPAECGTFVPDRRTFGSLGNDNLVGNPQSDLMYGLTGNDRIRSGPNPDCVEGGAGNDELSGEPGDDILIGRTGDDVLDGGNGRDQLFGGPGKDTLRGGNGIDHCDGGPAGEGDTFVGCETVAP